MKQGYTETSVEYISRLQHSNKQLLAVVKFIQSKRIYILAEFESGGRELIQLADAAIRDAEAQP